MATLAIDFQETTRLVVDEIAAILEAPVVAVDDWAQVIAAVDPRGRLTAAVQDRRPADGVLRIPLEVDGHRAQLLLGAGPDGLALSPLLAHAFVEQAIRHALLLSQHTTRVDLRNAFLIDVLEDRIRDQATIERQGGALGVHFTQNYGVLLLDATDYVLAPGPGVSVEINEGRIRQRIQVILSYLASALRLPQTAIHFYIGRGEFVVLQAIRPSAESLRPADGHGRAGQEASWAELPTLKHAGGALLARLRQAVTDPQAAFSIGVGRYWPGVVNLCHSYNEARFALRLGRSLQGPWRVHALDTLGVAAFVAEAPTGLKRELAEYLLTPLRTEATLRETLAVFFAQNGEIEGTATRLGIHRNTLRQRLERVEFLIGLNPRHLDDALQIRCALLLEAGIGEPAD